MRCSCVMGGSASRGHGSNRIQCKGKNGGDNGGVEKVECNAGHFGDDWIKVFGSDYCPRQANVMSICGVGCVV
jgi:hypothetical protein